MNQRGARRNRGAARPAARVAHKAAASSEGSARWRTATRVLLVVLLFGSVGVGALVDFGLRGLGLRWFPVFTLLWGICAFLRLGVAWVRLERRAARERVAQRREGPND